MKSRQEQRQENQHQKELAQIAAKLVGACDELGFEAPEFKTPPSIDCTRSIRRSPTRPGKYEVAVTMDGRLTSAVIADMIDGICHINNVSYNPDTSIADIEETHQFFWQATTS